MDSRYKISNLGITNKISNLAFMWVLLDSGQPCLSEVVNKGNEKWKVS